MSDYAKPVYELANEIYQYAEMEDEFCYLRDDRKEYYLELALFIHHSGWLARRLESSLEEALKLHEPIEGFGGDPSHWECSVCGDEYGPMRYPCPTVQAIKGARG